MLMLKSLWSHSRWMFSGHGNDVGADSSISRGLHVHTGLQEKKHTHIFFAFPTALLNQKDFEFWKWPMQSLKWRACFNIMASKWVNERQTANQQIGRIWFTRTDQTIRLSIYGKILQGNQTWKVRKDVLGSVVVLAPSWSQTPASFCIVTMRATARRL